CCESIPPQAFAGGFLLLAKERLPQLPDFCKPIGRQFFFLAGRLQPNRRPDSLLRFPGFTYALRGMNERRSTTAYLKGKRTGDNPKINPIASDDPPSTGRRRSR